MHLSGSFIRFALLTALSLLCTGGLGTTFAQTYKDVDHEGGLLSLPHEMTPEEELIRDLIGVGHRLTPPPSAQPVWALAEFDRMQGVLVCYPLGIGVNIVAEMSEDALIYCIVTSAQQSQAYNAFQGGGVNMGNVVFFNAYTDSWWVRDYGPWFIYDADENIGVVDVIYNRPRPNDDEIPAEFATFMGWDLYGPDIEHTGGNWMVDGRGIAASTDLVYAENPGMSPEDIDEIVHDYLGINTYHVRPDVNGEYIEHIDCWAKYLAPDKIMIREVPISHSQYDEIEEVVDYFESQISSYGSPYEVIRVWTPGNEPYTNSLILNNKVLVPTMGGSHPDAEAIAAYQDAMPGYEVLGFSGSWQSTDALHCRTRGVADPGLLYVWSIPLQNTANDEDPYPVTVEIVDYSQAGLIADQLRLYWRSGTSGPFGYEILTGTGGNSYYAEIPAQPLGTTVQYYLHAEDYSGRAEDCPLVGPDGPFAFLVQTDIVPPIIANTTDLRSTEDTEGPYYVETTVTDNMGVGEVDLLYRLNGAEFATLPMTDMGDNLYKIGIPGQPHTTYVEYCVRARDDGDNETYDPPGAPADLYDFYVAPESNLLFADMENGCDWTHSPVTGGFGDEWHLSTQRNHTPEGTTSWKCGDTGGGDYGSLLDAGLVTEEFELALDSRLSFWQWVEAESSNSYTGYAYDGGLVEINIGSGWEMITPEGGYPFKIRLGGNPGPFPAETGVFSGSRDWHAVAFDLADHEGIAQLRFRFGSDGAGVREGWYVDDISVDGFGIDPQYVPETHPRTWLALAGNWPNPVGAATTIHFSLARPAETTLRIYSTEGRLVRSLVDAQLAGGSYAIAWDRSNGDGRRVAPGVYFYRLESRGKELGGRMIVLR